MSVGTSELSLAETMRTTVPSISRRGRACAVVLLVVGPAALQGSTRAIPFVDTPALVQVAHELELAAPLIAPEVDGARFGSRAATRSASNDAGYIRTTVGCMADNEPETMDAELNQRVGPLIGWDNPHVIPLGDDRHLWLVNDSYLDYSFEANTLREVHPQLQNLAMIQDGTCFTMFHRGSLTQPANFEPGRHSAPPNVFYWPLGGEREGDVVKVFWAKMRESPKPPGFLDGIVRHPVSTWIGEYDVATLERLRFYRSPTSNVREPAGASRFRVQYGFAVVSTDTTSYLFGNANMLNLAMNGGYDNGPHPATRMYLAKVPRGRFDARPAYRTATGWSRDPNDAVPISERYFTENTMQPMRLGKNRWIATTKEDGFIGRHIVVEVAETPWGPWRTVQRIRYGDQHRRTTYHPILMPWRAENGDLIMLASHNANEWQTALDNPHMYRPSVAALDWPFD